MNVLVYVFATLLCLVSLPSSAALPPDAAFVTMYGLASQIQPVHDVVAAAAEAGGHAYHAVPVHAPEPSRDLTARCLIASIPPGQEPGIRGMAFVTTSDTTPPPMPPPMAMIVEAPYSSDPAQVTVNWVTCPPDPESGIAGHQVDLWQVTPPLVSPIASQYVSDTPVPQTTWTFGALAMLHAGVYQATVAGVNGAGLTGPPATSPTLTIDLTPPGPPPQIRDSGAGTDQLDRLSFDWSPAPEDISPIADYFLEIRDDLGAAVWSGWTGTSATSYTATGLALVQGSKYVGEVRARNAAGISGPLSPPSDGIMSVVFFPTIGAVKTMAAPGMGVGVRGVYTTAPGTGQPGGIYVQHVPRTTGIHTDCTDSIAMGSRVEIAGILQHNQQGELELWRSEVATEGGSATVTPFAMSNRSLGGGPLGLQPGVIGGSGANNVGLLVQVWGRVTKVYPGPYGWFVVDDGSGCVTQQGDSGILVASQDFAQPGLGAIVTVRGVCGYMNGYPYVRMCREDDRSQAGYRPSKIAVVAASDATATDVHPVVTAFLGALGLNWEGAEVDASGYVQPLTGGTGSTYQDSVDGIIVIDGASFGTVSNLSAALSAATSTKKMLVLEPNLVGANAGMQNVKCQFGTGTVGPLALYSDPTGIDEQGPINTTVRFWTVAVHDGDITGLLYCKDGANPKGYVMWEYTYAGGQPHQYAYVGRPLANAKQIILLCVGVYLAQMKISTKQVPLYLSVDDSNIALSPDCIDSFAAALREVNGSVVSAWGSNALIHGGVNATTPPAQSEFQEHPDHPGIAAAWARALDVCPHLLHDHKLYGKGPYQTILNYNEAPLSDEDRRAAFLARLDEAEAWAGFDLKVHYKGFTIMAWNLAVDAGRALLGSLGARFLRNVVASGTYSLADGRSYYLATRGITPGANGEWEETRGADPISAIRGSGVSGPGGLVFAGPLTGDTYYLHGPQFARNNYGGLMKLGNRAMAAGDSVTVGGHTYNWVASGASPENREINVSGNLDTDLANLKAFLDSDLSGVATVTIVSGDTQDTYRNGCMLIRPVASDTDIAITCSVKAAGSVFPVSCIPDRDVATEILMSNYIRACAVAPCFRVARPSDWAVISE